MEEKKREELLRSATTNQTNFSHVQLTLDHDQNELRHTSRLNRANNGKLREIFNPFILLC